MKTVESIRIITAKIMAYQIYILAATQNRVKAVACTRKKGKTAANNSQQCFHFQFNGSALVDISLSNCVELKSLNHFFPAESTKSNEIDIDGCEFDWKHFPYFA